MIGAIYHYGRFYARSEKHLSERLDEVCGKGNWHKSKRMFDTFGRNGVAAAREVNAGRPNKSPVFAGDPTHNGGWEYSTQAYRGVIFRTKEAATKARMMIPLVADMAPDDMVVARSFHEVRLDHEARYWGLGPTGLPWEDKSVAQSVKDETTRRDREFRDQELAELRDERGAS
jgi:hypothetical protein